MTTPPTSTAPPAGRDSTPPAAHRPGRSSDVDSLVRIVAPRYWIALISLLVFLGGVLVWSIAGTLENQVDGAGVLVPGGTVREVHVSESGVLDGYSVQIGAEVSAGQPIGTLVLATGAQQTVTTPTAGQVSSLAATVGEPVQQGQVVAVLTDPTAPLEVVGTVPAAAANVIAPGNPVRVTPIVLNSDGLETVQGTVSEVSALPVSTGDLTALVGSESLAADLTAAGAVKSVIVTLSSGGASDSGYVVSNQNGTSLQLQFGTMVQFEIVTSSSHPIDQVVK